MSSELAISDMQSTQCTIQPTGSWKPASKTAIYAPPIT